MRETPHEIAAGLHNRLLDNDLDVEDRRRLAEHRAACDACDASFTGIEGMVLALDGLERFEPRPGFADRILAEVRPAPLPVWARWQVSTPWSRAAAYALLVGGGLTLLAATLVLRSVVGELSGPALVFRGPELLTDAMLALLQELDPLRAVGEILVFLGRTLLVAAAAPQILVTLSGIALLSATAFLRLSQILAAPTRRRSSHV
jgi:anti-sigma factor RsiW